MVLVKDLELVLQQRDRLVNNIEKLDDNINKAVIAFLAGIISLAVFLREETGAINMSPIALFIIIQLVLLLIMYMTGLILARNQNMEFIAAIDSFVKEKYKIGVLFYQGELFIEYTTGIKSTFSKQMVLIGMVSAITIIGIFYFEPIRIMILQMPRPFLIIIGLEVLLYIFILVLNLFLKHRRVCKDCLNYLNTSVGCNKSIHNH